MNKLEMLSQRLDGKSYQQIATQAGISRQRVQQILSPPRVIRQYIYDKYLGSCDDCSIFVNESGHIHHKTTETGLDDYNDIDNLVLLCSSCHRRAHTTQHGLYPADINNPVCPRCERSAKRIGVIRPKYPRKRPQRCHYCGLSYQYPRD